jgi:hypothetical protein
MDSGPEQCRHGKYGQGYFVDVDALREQEYPLLSRMAPYLRLVDPLVLTIIFYGYRDNLS